MAAVCFSSDYERQSQDIWGSPTSSITAPPPSPTRSEPSCLLRQVLRQAAQSLKAGDISAFYEALAVASFRGSEHSITLARAKDPDGALIGVSKGFEALTGYSKAEVLGRNLRCLNRGCHIPSEVRHRLRLATRTGRSFAGVLQNRRKGGEVFSNLVTMRGLRVGTAYYMLGLQADVTDLDLDVDSDDMTGVFQEIVDGIFAATINAWATVQVSHFTTTKLGELQPQAQSEQLRQLEPELYDKAQELFVSLEHSVLPGHILYKNTFVEVHGGDGDEDAEGEVLTLRTCWSEPSLRSNEDFPVWSSLRLLEDLDGDLFEQDQDLVHQYRLPSPSLGSALHNNGCVPCNWFCYSQRGCNRGEDCSFCHMDHPRRSRRRVRKRRDRTERRGSRSSAASEALEVCQSSPSSVGTMAQAPVPPQAKSTPMDLLPLLNALELLAPLPASLIDLADSASAAEFDLADPTCPALLRRKLRMEQPADFAFVYHEDDVVVEVGSWKTLIPLVQRPSSGYNSNGLRFDVFPGLPRGLHLDPSTGVINGVPVTPSEPQGSLLKVVMTGSFGARSTALRLTVVPRGSY